MSRFPILLCASDHTQFLTTTTNMQCLCQRRCSSHWFHDLKDDKSLYITHDSGGNLNDLET